MTVVHTLSPMDRLLLVRSMPMLTDLDVTSLAMVANAASERRYRPGDELLRPDFPVTEAFILVSGSVEVLWQGQSRMRVHAPNGVGFIEMLADTRDARIVAREPVLALALSGDAWMTVLEERPGMARVMLRSIASVLSTTGLSPPGEASPRPARPGPYGLVDRLAVLAAEPSLQDINLDALIPVARTLRERRVEVGESLWRLDDPSPTAAILMEGTLRCVLRDHRVVEVPATQLLGMLDALGGLPRSFTATATTPCVVLEEDIDQALVAAETQHSLALAFLKKMAAELIAIDLGQSHEVHGRQSPESMVQMLSKCLRDESGP